jgi:hypothetical protein
MQMDVGVEKMKLCLVDVSALQDLSGIQEDNFAWVEILFEAEGLAGSNR